MNPFKMIANKLKREVDKQGQQNQIIINNYTPTIQFSDDARPHRRCIESYNKFCEKCETIGIDFPELPISLMPIRPASVGVLNVYGEATCIVIAKPDIAYTESVKENAIHRYFPSHPEDTLEEAHRNFYAKALDDELEKIVNFCENDESEYINWKLLKALYERTSYPAELGKSWAEISDTKLKYNAAGKCCGGIDQIFEPRLSVSKEGLIELTLLHSTIDFNTTDNGVWHVGKDFDTSKAFKDEERYVYLSSEERELLLRHFEKSFDFYFGNTSLRAFRFASIYEKERPQMNSLLEESKNAFLFQQISGIRLVETEKESGKYEHRAIVVPIIFKDYIAGAHFFRGTCCNENDVLRMTHSSEFCDNTDDFLSRLSKSEIDKNTSQFLRVSGTREVCFSVTVCDNRDAVLHVCNKTKVPWVEKTIAMDSIRQEIICKVLEERFGKSLDEIISETWAKYDELHQQHAKKEPALEAPASRAKKLITKTDPGFIFTTNAFLKDV